MNPQTVAAHFPIGRILGAYRVGSLGFSGSIVFRIDAECGAFALKRLSDQYPIERLPEIHRVLRFVVEHGCTSVASPLLDQLGNCAVATAAGNWELTKWMPGTADFNQRPSTSRLHDMMRQVAHFHNLTAEYSRHWAPSPGIAERLRELHNFAKLVPEMRLVIPPLSLAHPDLEYWFQRALCRLPTFIDRLVSAAPSDASADFCLQPVAKDLWHDHLLFEGDSVSGMIDFHAMRVDTPLLDVARLVGSLKVDGAPPWNAALQAYSQFRESPNYADVWVRWLHACGVALSIVNWIKWVSVEKRCFLDWPSVVRRTSELVLELERIDEE